MSASISRNYSKQEGCLRSWWCCIALSVLCLGFSAPNFADIRFEEVTREAGIRHTGTTYGASWGDFNGDGWPDLWVGNHNTKPSLYLNQRNGSFDDVIDSVWSADPLIDAHGVQWADFDNDGDQDLVEVADVDFQVEPRCVGCAPNHLFVNEGGSLRDEAGRLGLDDPKAQARTPLWLDADRDGRLDLLVMKIWRSKKRSTSTSTLFRQTGDGFKPANEEFGLRDNVPVRRGIRYKLEAYRDNLTHLRLRSPPIVDVKFHHEFAQLADLSGDGDLDLITYSQPTRVYSIRTKPFVDITNDLEFPELSDIGDVAIEDFNGDSLLDLYMTRGPYRKSQIVQTNSTEFRGTILSKKKSIENRDAKAVHFVTEGEVNFRISPTWVKLSKVFIGSEGKHPEAKSFTLRPDDPSVAGPVSAVMLEQGGVSITYDADSYTWSLSNAITGDNIDFIVSSTKAVTSIATTGFGPFQEIGIDALLVKRGDEFVIKPLAGEAGVATACQSVVAGDFDNDMDMDLYLTCAGPVVNIPNRLFENGGKANFAFVPDAGGAAGSKLGRSDVVVTADFDQDGFLDLFVTNGSDPTSLLTENGPHQLFRNLGNSNHWLEIDLEGSKSNRDGIGAKLVLEAGGVTQVRGQGGGMHRFSQNHQRVHFGTGQNVNIDRLTVLWPSGIKQTLENIEADQILRVKESVQ